MFANEPDTLIESVKNVKNVKTSSSVIVSPIKNILETRMHSSSMRTAHSLTISRSICHAWPPSHACPPPRMPPAMHASLPCMPSVMHTSPTMHAPRHAHPATMHASLPHMAPHHAHPHPPAKHDPPPPWTEFLTHASENITLPQLRCGR